MIADIKEKMKSDINFHWWATVNYPPPRDLVEKFATEKFISEGKEIIAESVSKFGSRGLADWTEEKKHNIRRRSQMLKRGFNLMLASSSYLLCEFAYEMDVFHSNQNGTPFVVTKLTREGWGIIYETMVESWRIWRKTKDYNPSM